MDVKFFHCPNDGSPIDPAKGKCDYCEARFMVISLANLARFDKAGVNKYISQYKELLKANPDDGELNCAMGIC